MDAMPGDKNFNPEQRNFVNTWNEGTPEYEVFAPLVDSLPWEELKRRYLPKADVDVRGKAVADKRGNIQISFGYSSGQSMQKRNAAVVDENYGAAIPSLRRDTNDPLIKRTLEMLSTIVELVGAKWTDAEYLSRNPDVVQRLKHFTHKMSPLICFDTAALTLMPLDAKAQVNKHTDNQNCGELSQVVSLQRVVRDEAGL